MTPVLEATKRAMDLNCKVKLTHTYDVQSGTAWLVEAWDYSRLSQKDERVNLGYLVAAHVEEVKAYAESLGRPFTSKERDSRPWDVWVPAKVQDYRRPRKVGRG